MGWNTHYDEANPFVANQHSLIRAPGRQIDWDAVGESYKQGTEYTITINDAAAAEGDTSVTVTALGVALPVGTVLDFGEHSVDSVQMLAKLAAAAAVGDTTLTVEPLGHGIEDASTATYIDESATDGVKTIPAGTAMAALSSGKVVPRVARPGSETAIGLLEASATEDDVGGASGYGIIRGGVIYKNLLPDYSAGEPWDTIEGELEAAGVGMGWVWETYSDDTTS